MKRLLIVAAALGTLALAGCFSSDGDFYTAPKPVDKMSHEELCSFYQHYRENPSLSESGREITTRQMRAKGCAA